MGFALFPNSNHQGKKIHPKPFPIKGYGPKGPQISHASSYRPKLRCGKKLGLEITVKNVSLKLELSGLSKSP